MKKILMYTAAVLLITIITVGGTYAYFFATIASDNDAANTNSTKLDVIYTKGDTIDGFLNLSSDKTGGINTTINIKVAEDSVMGIADLYFNIEEITANLAIASLHWEVYKTIDEVESFVNRGTFEGKQTGDKFTIVDNYKLSATNTAFTVYIWLDGNAVGNEVLTGKIKGYISASIEQFTAELK